MPQVSVIVPIYNAEKHLRKCLDSILNQTFKDFEIIAVNDGSTDNSESILNEYLQKYDYIKYYKKNHTGVADSRNFGVEKATGIYITFVDSDDYISKDLLNNLEIYIKQCCDLIKFKLVKVDINGNELERIKGPVFEIKRGEEAFNELCYKDVLIDSPCIYLIKRSFFNNNNFKFAIDTYHEDFGLIPLLIIKSNTVVSVKEYGYFYLQSENSITRNSDYNYTLKKAYDILKHYDNMTEKIKSYIISAQSRRNIKTYFTNVALLKVYGLKKADRKAYIKEIKRRKMFKNIKIVTPKQLLKRILLIINVELYLKLRK